MPAKRSFRTSSSWSALSFLPIWLVAASAAALAIRAGTVNIPGTTVRLEDKVIGIAAIALAAFPFLARVRGASPRSSYIAAAVALSGLVVVAAFYRVPALGDRSFGVTHWNVRHYTSSAEWYESITSKHPTYGFAGVPGANGLHLVEGSNLVRYTLNESGWREQQKETMQPDEFWFLGGELPFGSGVSDGEGFVDRLAMVWRDYKIRNFSHKWYGASNAYRVVEEQIPGQPKPRAVLLSWSGADRHRNYRRQSWFRTLPDLDYPVFGLENGKARFLGLQPTSSADEPDDEDTDRKELQITHALIRGIAAMCADHRVPFVLLVLSNQDRTAIGPLRNDPNLHIWDVSDLERAFPLGSRDWHQAVAHRILNDRFLADLLNRPSLLSPDSFPPPKADVVRQLSQPVTMRDWRLDGPAIGEAQMTFPKNDRVKVTFPERKYREWWELSLVYPAVALQLKANEPYSLEWRFRAKEVKRVVSRIKLANAEVFREATMTPAWQTARQPFTVPADTDVKQIALSAGRDSVEFEVASLRLYSEKSNVDLLSPSSTLPDAEQPSDIWLPDVSKLQFWSEKWYNNAVLHKPAIPGAPLRLTQRGWSKGVGNVQIKLPFAMKKGSTYSFHIEVRSTEPRKFGYTVIRNEPPWTELCDVDEVITSIHWQRIERGFFATQDVKEAALTLYAGGSDKTLEIRSLQVLEDGRNVMTAAGNRNQTAGRPSPRQINEQ